MSEDGSNTAFPQEDGQDGFQIDSFLPPAGEPLPELVHCKVPLGAWLGESVVFGKRYFWRLLLLGFIVSVLSLGFSSRYRQNPFVSGTLCTEGVSALIGGSAALAADEGADAGEEIDFFASESEPDAGAEPPAQDEPQTAAEASPPAGKGEEPADAGPSEDAASPSDAETDVLKTIPCFGLWKNDECGSCCASHPAACLVLGSVLWILAVLLGLMSHLWGIRTVQKDDGSWRNLLFPSWKTLPRLVLAWLIFVFIFSVIAAGFVILFGSLGAKFGSQIEMAGMFLTALLCLFVLLRYAMTAHLILDRDYGPIKALNTSWEFMKSNAGTLLTGFILYSLVLFVLALIVLVPLAFMLGNQDISDPDRLYQHILSTPALAGTASAAMLLFNTLSQIGSIALASVFYLMATGQKRPGAWPREDV
ncbi:MAG: hypothetical protein IJG60_00720 [Thermoguttaceae bacterium]|nr:hypothetical protein [Thermoguttaceae bacterium]